MSGQTASLTPDLGAVEQLAILISDYGLQAAGALLLLTAIAVFNLALNLASRNSRIAGFIASGVSLVLGIALIVAGVYWVPPGSTRSDHLIAEIANVPAMIDVRSGGEHTYVRTAQRSQGCIKKVRILHLVEDSHVRLEFLDNRIPGAGGSDVKQCEKKFPIRWDGMSIHGYEIPVARFSDDAAVHYLQHDYRKERLRLGGGDGVAAHWATATRLVRYLSADPPVRWAGLGLIAEAHAVQSKQDLHSALARFRTGDSGEIYAGARGLAAEFPRFQDPVVKALHDPKIAPKEAIGLLLTIRLDLKARLQAGNEIPPYDEALLQALFLHALSDDAVVRNNVRIILRTQPSDAVRNLFRERFETASGPDKAKLAAIGADIHYNAAMEQMIVYDRSRKPARAIYRHDPVRFEQAIALLREAWDWRDLARPGEAFLMAKLKYGEGLLFSKAATAGDVARSGRSGEYLATADKALALFLDAVDRIEGHYVHEHHVEIAKTCRAPVEAPERKDLEGLDSCIARATAIF